MSLDQFTFGTVVLRLLAAAAAGGAVGYGRSKKDRAAGLRTFMLISIGAAISVLLTIYLYVMLMNQWAPVVEELGLKFDASRLAGQALTGIGFLGAGIIIKAAHQQVKGLTTATGLFATVCLGLAAGAGFFKLVIPSTILIILVLNVFWPLESAFKRRLRNITLHVTFSSADDIAVITEALRQQQANIYDIDIEQSESKGDLPASAVFVMKLSKENHSHSSMLSTVAELPCVLSVQELLA